MSPKKTSTNPKCLRIDPPKIRQISVLSGIQQLGAVSMDRILNMIVRLVIRRLTRRAVQKGAGGLGKSNGPKFQKARTGDIVRVARRVGRL
jgi:hypothetical protein